MKKPVGYKNIDGIMQGKTSCSSLTKCPENFRAALRYNYYCDVRIKPLTMKNSDLSMPAFANQDELLQAIEPDETPINDPKEKPEVEPDNLPVEEPGVDPLTKPDEDDDDDDPFTETEIGDDPDEISKKTTIM